MKNSDLQMKVKKGCKRIVQTYEYTQMFINRQLLVYYIESVTEKRYFLIIILL